MVPGVAKSHTQLKQPCVHKFNKTVTCLSEENTIQRTGSPCSSGYTSLLMGLTIWEPHDLRGKKYYSWKRAWCSANTCAFFGEWEIATGLSPQSRPSPRVEAELGPGWRAAPLRGHAPSSYFQPLGAVSQYPAFQELAALCLLFSHGLGLTLELIFALQVQWRKLNEDTQGPKGLISWNSEMKARGSQSVTLSASCHVNTASRDSSLRGEWRLAARLNLPGHHRKQAPWLNKAHVKKQQTKTEDCETDRIACGGFTKGTFTSSKNSSQGWEF